MRTHGEKRIRAVLEVFHAAHSIVAGMGTQEHLVVRIIPRRIDQVEQWIGRALQRPGIPSPQEIFDYFVQPAPGANPHRCHAADRYPGRKSVGHRRPDHQRATRGTDHGADPCPRLPTAQRDQRHHDGPLADGPAPVARAPREIPDGSQQTWTRCPICGSSTPPSNCSIPARGAAQRGRWSRRSTWSSPRTTCSKCRRPAAA